MKRAITVNQMLMKKFDAMEFEGKWEASFGKPERSGVWLVWGGSGNGKTRFCMQLAKYLTRFGTVAYNTLEEGARMSMQRVLIDSNMKTVSSKFILLDGENKAELNERLTRKKSPDIIIIDSFQYLGLTKLEYTEFKSRHKSKLFIFISHAEGLQPAGRTANFVKYDADIKIHVHAYEANPISRYGGGEPYIIWEAENKRIKGL